MAYQIYVALTTEGTTDIRFLENVIERTLWELACSHLEQEVECVVNVLTVDKAGLSFEEYVKKAAKEALSQFGANTLAVHTDADRMTYEERRTNKIVTVEEFLQEQNPNDYCLILTPVIPVRMIEAWMLSDRDLLRQEIGTSLTNAQLEIDGNPEIMASPKEKIENAIRLAREKATHRNPIKSVDISDLYGILGQKLSIEKLEGLDSFRKFEGEVLETFRKMGLRMKA